MKTPPLWLTIVSAIYLSAWLVVIALDILSLIKTLNH